MADALGWRKRIGFVVPSTNTTVQPEVDDLRPRGVTFHLARVSIKERPLTSEQAFLEHVQAMRDGLGAAIEQVMTSAPDHLVMGVALEAFWGGVAASQKLEAELAEKAGVGITMGSTATAAALRAFGATRIAILTPHQPRGDEMVRAWFVESGFDVLRLKGLKCPSPREIAHVQPATIRESLRELDGPDVEALVVVGTNLAGAAVAAEGERWLGKPVLAINTVLTWHALRAIGIEDRVFGHGRVLEEH
ncbi:maleate cis-trans isomerase family protein [Falsiroseomonas stagni]|uniref:Maleate isomerase n=1 Tax=Falsiroseomonas stagni DSM 19981 TaxID=1123062 RepID=A0A1I4DUQ4_9PROT|nr:Asp/Glu racemase [Falsiroseomonas stagni]SFK95967.1 maleate isomerase [Falsiroseomonas stagni DSM 19981]